MLDLSAEIRLKTARSGGSGGQNVNKVESMVEGYFQINDSNILSTEEKLLVHQKLYNRINKQGALLVKSQEERTQLGNREIVIRKINLLVEKALIIQKKRKATKPSRFSKEKNKASKQMSSERKVARRKVRLDS